MLLVLLVLLVPGSIYALAGDINNDGVANAADATTLANLIVRGDINGDGVVDMRDVQALAEIIVDAPPSPPPALRVITLPGGVPLELVHIPAGSFVMGSPSDERNRFGSEGPQTPVAISQSFYMGKYEVTQAQWWAVMGSNPALFQSADRPVEQVSWNDAQDFVTALNEHIEATNQGPAIVRLPTEAEWEYAARAGTLTRFSFGNSLSVPDGCEDDGVRGQYMWYCGNADNQTNSVGQKLPNDFGLYDMHGNVWEWCQDWVGTYSGVSVTDPTGPTTGSNRVLRGGGWANEASSCRSAHRGTNRAPSYQHSTLGLRLAAGL